MSQHVIVGAGAIGSTTATILAGRGESVRLVTRRGSGPEHPAIERIAADAGDADRLSRLTEGAIALYNCASPEYHKWFTDWPPIHTALLAAAERTGATLVTMSNLYGYGEVTGPITPRTPLSSTHPKLKLRADMWRDALALHEAGKIRATEARASDYIEANSLLSYAMGKPMLAGKRVYSPAPLDVPHSWTSTYDAAATLATIATDERAFGRAWLVPTHPALTVRQMAGRFAKVAGAPKPKLSQVPWPVMWTYGLFDPTIKELRTTRYQFTRPFVIDSTETTATFGIEPRPLEETLRAAVTAVRAG
jgi:nucleoside-diphosphate-sugar epimerase